MRPGLDVWIASPETTERKLADFRPHLPVHNDNDGLDPGAVADVLCRVEVQYSNGMDALISAGGEVSQTRDMSTEVSLRVVDRAIALADPEAGQS